MAIDQTLIDAMREKGLDVDDGLVADENIHRCHVQGDRCRTKNGWYVIFESAAVFGNWKTGERSTWHRERGNEDFNRSHWLEEIEKSKAARELQRLETARLCREQAEKIWNDAKPAPNDHPYLLKKHVKSYGLRVSSDGRLIVPLRKDGVLHGLQYISADGDKRFLTGTAKTGCWFGIGKPDGKLLIAEGYATAASLYKATNYAVAVAFDAGNLLPVAKHLKLKFPHIQHVICADNDQWTDGNPGVTKATEAAIEIDGFLAVPCFAKEGGEEL